MLTNIVKSLHALLQNSADNSMELRRWEILRGVGYDLAITQERSRHISQASDACDSDP